MNPSDNPRFPVGQLVATANALRHITHEDIVSALWRHVSGDWGDVCQEDRLLNDQAVVAGTRIISTYRAATGIKFWIITEADRSVTTILLPEDY